MISENIPGLGIIIKAMEPDEAQLRGNARSQVELGSEEASPQQPPPIAADRRAQAEQSRHEDRDVSGLDLLHGARVQVGEFGQPLLRQPARGSSNGGRVPDFTDNVLDPRRGGGAFFACC